MNNLEVTTLTNTLDYTRNFSKTYFSLLTPELHHKTYSCNGVQLNSAFWIIAHLAVTENYLCLRSTGGEMVKFSWAKLFGLGSQPPSEKDCPPIKEVLDVFNSVHEKSIQHLKSLSDADLSKPTATQFSFFGEDSFRRVITHSISHEGIHAGHLGWICKLNGIKTL